MGTGGFKDLMQKVSFLRDYSSLVVPVVIGVVAALLFIPTQLMSGKLKADIADESVVSRGNKVTNLEKKAVPSEQWKVEEQYQKDHQKDANQVSVLAVQSTERTLLSYKLFPKPTDTSVGIYKGFGRQFRESVDGLLLSLNALDCPSEAELAIGMRGSKSSTGRTSPFGGKSAGRLSKVNETIKEDLCQRKAESASVYANAADFAGYEFWEDYQYVGMDEAVEDCWYWQLAYWIIEDVTATVKALNSGSNSVYTSPAKRIMTIQFTTGGMKRGSGGGYKPSYVPSSDGGLTKSHTERFCNEDIDVVHFNVAVVVRTEALGSFMKELCSAKEHQFMGFSGAEQGRNFKHNQITILESNISSVIREDSDHNLYRYGNEAVIELDLICEYVFSKKGYDEIKPDSVKESLERTVRKKVAPKSKKEKSKSRSKGKARKKTSSKKR